MVNRQQDSTNQELNTSYRQQDSTNQELNTLNRQQIHKVTVIDLDQTYLRCNSLKLYLKNALRHAAKSMRLDRVARILTLFALRRLRLISHETMKYRAIEAAGESPEMMESFQRLAKGQINPNIAEIIKERRKNGEEVLLATAAAECYVPLIWDGPYIASPMGGPDCRGDRKRDAVIRWTTAHNSEISCFLTDHREDLPLAIYSAGRGAEVILVNPDPKSREAFERELPAVAILSPTLWSPPPCELPHRRHRVRQVCTDHG